MRLPPSSQAYRFFHLAWRCLPFLHCYLESVLRFNLSSGFVGGTSSFTMMNLLYEVFPPSSNSPAYSVENQVWLAVNRSPLRLCVRYRLVSSRELNPVDIVAIGLLVWLIPLRQIYAHYLV